MVVSAGDAGVNLDTSFAYPASYRNSNLIAVGASDDTDALAAFSNYGYHTVDVMAPGVNIVSTNLGGGYAMLSGTTLAAPFVSGAAALLLSECPLDTPRLRTTLLTNADPVAGVSGNSITYGRLNAYKALHGCTPVLPIAAPAQPAFSLNPATTSFTLTLNGTATTTTIGVAGAAAFSGAVSFRVLGLPGGVTASFAPALVVAGGTTTLKLTPTAAAVAGSYQFTIVGTNGNATVSLPAWLQIDVAPAFQLTATPQSQAIARGAAAGYTITATPIGGFAGPIAMQVAAIPTYSSVSFAAAAGAVTMTVTTTTRTPAGTWRMVVTGSATVNGKLLKEAVEATLTTQ
jgi:hypothetical protein